MMHARRSRDYVAAVALAIVLVLGGAGSALANSPWQVPITVAEPGYAWDETPIRPITLTIGYAPTATTGLDEGLGELVQPPMPPNDIFDARLLGVEDGLLLDLRRGTSPLDVETFTVSLQWAKPDSHAVILSWDPAGFMETTYSALLQDQFGGLLGVNVDMRTTSELAVTDPDITRLRIVVTPVDPYPPIVPTTLTFVQVPTGVISGQPMAPALQVRASDDGNSGSINRSVTIALASGPGTLSGTLTATTDASGVATFTGVTYNATADGGEPFSLTATCASPVLTAGSAPITSQVVATRLVFTTQPGGSVSGAVLATQPVVQGTDANGIVDLDYTGPVTLSVASGGGALAGTLSVPAVAGVAAFAGVAYTAAADQASVTLGATDGNLTAISAAFTSDVLATRLVFTTEPATAYGTAPLLTQPVVAARDAQGTADAGFTGTVTLRRASGTGTLAGTVAVTAVGGVATFADVAYTAPADETFTLSAEAAGLTPVTSSPIQYQGPPVAHLTLSVDTVAVGVEVVLQDVSTGVISGRSWALGDGATSSSAVVRHAYAAPGVYQVELTVSGPGGSATAVDTVRVFAAPVAGFSGSATSGTSSLTVGFTNASSGLVTAWLWAFGDGTTSTLINPSHTYGPGTYSVSLTVTGPGGTNTLTRAGYIVVNPPPPQAEFSANPSSGPAAPLVVQFSDQSTGTVTAWAWSFGDGSTSAERNPSHTYTALGYYTVSLTVTGAGQNSFRSQTITVGTLRASFSVTPQSGVAPLTVTFANTSTLAQGYAWIFDTGEVNEVTPAPRTFTTPGTYPIRLRAYGPGNSFDDTTLTVQVLSPLTAAFSLSHEVLVLGQSVTLTDLSQGQVTSRSWELGDGVTRSDSNFSYTYAAVDTYTVRLSVSGPAGATSAQRQIAVLKPLQAGFAASRDSVLTGGEVAFSDTSKGWVQAWAWTFGDGSSSSVQNPTHAYAQAGTYQVSLTVSGPAGQSQAARTVRAVNPLTAAFTVSRDSVRVGLPVTFTDTSPGRVIARSWDLGDGATRTDSTFSYTYPAASTYTVRLSVTGTMNPASAQRQIVVLAPLQAGFRVSPDSVLTGEAMAFTDTSRGLVRAWTWAFGDGSTSALQNPTHAYPRSGTYEVALTVTGPAGESRTTRAVRVVNRPPVIAPAIRDTSVNEDTALELVLTPHETDDQDTGTALTWRVAVESGSSRLASFTATGGTADRFTFQPVPDSAGQVQVRFTLTDSQGATGSQAATLTWLPTADPPRVAAPAPADRAVEVPPGAVALGWEGRDPDPGDRLTYTVRVGRADPPDSVVATAQTAASVLLGRLQAGRTYFWQVTARDASGLTTSGPVWRFTTEVDRTPPTITLGPSTVGLGQRQATVQWTTDEASTGTVNYSLRADYGGARSDSLTALILDHQVSLTSLLPDTTYYYRVSSRDEAGNRSAARAGQFRTLAVPDSTAPQVLSGPLAVGITDQQAQVEWVTDEAGSSRVELGLTPGLTPATVQSDPALVRQHSVALAGLQADTTYYYRVSARDAAGNLSLPRSGQFRTHAAPDTLAPQLLRGPSVVGITPERATVAWATDEVSSSVVEYGLTPSLGSFRRLEESITEHAVVLTGLAADTTYHYQAYSTDPSGNTSARRGGQFRTMARPDTVAPRILTGPVASGVTDQAATVRWTTDEVSSTRVDYGLRVDLTGATTQEQIDALTAHALTLTNLRADTTYYYRVRSTDVAGNPSAAKSSTFRTAARPDTLAPTFVTGPAPAGIDNQSARIEWETDEDADGTVAYGLSRLDQTVQQPSRLRRQSVALTNLLADTLYQAQVTVSDQSGNRRVSRTIRFRTLAAPDTTAPRIATGPVVLSRTADQAAIEWTTDEPSDSQVEYGLTPALGQAAQQVDDVQRHTVQLTNLLPETLYHYRVRSTDRSGNGPTSSLATTFRTLARPDTSAPRITAAPVVLQRTDQTATIGWSTDEPADGYVEYSRAGGSQQSAGSEEYTLIHEVKLTNLAPATTYQYRVRSADAAGNGPTRNLTVLSFTTRAAPDLLPPVLVSRPTVLARTPSSATVQWLTDEPADSRVEYGPDGRYGQEILQPEGVTVHTVLLSGLLADTEYHLQASSTDAAGNGPTQSQDVALRTLAAPDTLAPRILVGPTVTNLTASGATVEWTTDEPANSVVDFGKSRQYGLGPIERGELVLLHVVSLTNLEPGTTYHLRVASTDASGNTVDTDSRGTKQFSRDHNFHTLRLRDQAPPVFLEGPVVFARDQAAAVEWRTDEPTRFTVVFDTQPTFNSPDRDVIESNEYRERQAAELTNLQPGTSYYYRLTVWDRDDNSRTASTAGAGGALGKGVAKLAQPPGGAGSFVTRPDPDTQWPVILTPPRVTARTSSTITVEWETDERSDSFIEFGAGAGSGEMQGQAGDQTWHRVVLTNLRAGQSYQYEAQSTDPSGNGATRSARLVASTDLELDLVPPRLTQTPRVVWRTDQAATIEWATDEQSTSLVEYGVGDLSGRRQDAELTRQHRVTLTNLSSGTVHQFRASSVDGSGNGPTTSAVDTFRTDPTPDLSPPRIVQGPTVLPPSDQAVTLVWQTDEMADSFVDYGTDAADLGKLIGSAADVTEHRLTLTNLTAGTTYFARVGSVDRSNNPPVTSPVVSFTTSAGRDLTAPATPRQLSGQAGSQAARLAWAPNTETDLAGYNLYRRTVGAAGFGLVASQLQEVAYLDAGLSNGVGYEYQVTAVDRAPVPNESLASPRVTVTPAADGVPEAPSSPSSRYDGQATTLVVANPRPVAGRVGLSYTFQVSTDLAFSDVVASAARVPEGSPESTSWSFVRVLDPSGVYWWRARANDGVFDGAWMVPAQLDLAIQALVGDFSGDGTVGFDDFFLFADHFGLGAGDAAWEPLYDLSQNGAVDFDDFFLFADRFGTSVAASKSAELAGTPSEAGPRLRLVHLTPQSAVLALEWAAGTPVRGCGVILSHAGAVTVESAAAEGGARTAAGSRALAGVLHRQPTRTWWAGYWLDEAPPVGAAPGFELVLTLGRDAVGTEVTLEEIWVTDGAGGVSRLAGGSRLALLPQAFSLAAPYPNPFNPAVQIEYTVPRPGPVRVEVYDILGQQVRTLASGSQPAGLYRVLWDGRDDRGRTMASGVYLVRMAADGFARTRKIALVR